jgi:putative transposase
LVRLPPFLVVRHLVLDAHFGHPAAAQMARAVGLHLVSKLRSDAALYREPTPQEKQAHPRKKYGDKVDYCALPQECRVSCEQAEGVRTEVYQIRCWHKDFPERLNILIVLKTDLSAQKRGHIVLFSTDLTLSAEALWDGYALRFQIEFVFRDAKQHFGLDDFQAVNETAVANAVGLSLLLVNLTEVLLEPLRQEREEASILDLKAYFRGRRYAQETLKWLPVLPEGIVWEQLLAQVARLGSIHPFAWVARRGLRKQPNAQCRGEREAPQAP